MAVTPPRNGLTDSLIRPRRSLKTDRDDQGLPETRIQWPSRRPGTVKVSIAMSRVENLARTPSNGNRTAVATHRKGLTDSVLGHRESISTASRKRFAFLPNPTRRGSAAFKPRSTGVVSVYSALKGVQSLSRTPSNENGEALAASRCLPETEISWASQRRKGLLTPRNKKRARGLQRLCQATPQKPSRPPGTVLQTGT